MVKVVVARCFEEANIERVRGIGGDLDVSYRADLVPPPRWEGDVVGEAGWRRTDAQNEEFEEILSDAEILLDFPRGLRAPLAELAPNLRWIQGGMAGAGPVARNAGLLDTDVVVTTASGVFSNPLAEFVLGGMLSHAKDFEKLRKRKASKAWIEEETGTLEGKTLCIIGTGSIGRAMSERARPFGMKILGVKRTAREDDEARKYTDELYPAAKLHAALGEADYVAATLPHTESTEGLVDEAAMDAMKPGAYFANVGRGAVVDEGGAHRKASERANIGCGARCFRRGAIAGGERVVGARERHNKPAFDGQRAEAHGKKARGVVLREFAAVSRKGAAHERA